MSYLIIAHLVGDFLLQNDWMQAKSRSSSVCAAHVACYSIPFLLIWGATGWPLWVLAVILAEHWAQDRFGLHLKWMRAYGQTTPDKWPVGPLCVDQSMHLAVIAALSFSLST